MKFGHCKNCWWQYKNFCYMSDNEVKDDSYCPDYYNRRKGNKEDCKLKDWINQHPDVKQINELKGGKQ